MEIKNFKTKFALGDVVYFMYQNEINRGIVTRIRVVFEEGEDVNSYIHRVIQKITNLFNNHKTYINVYYHLTLVKNNDTFDGAIINSFLERELASSKEELFRMLSKDMK